MSDLALLHESVVSPEEIDSLGHMNVRFYIARVARANEELLRRAGLLDSAVGNLRVRRNDTYTRFLKEQFADAPLQTLGGFVCSGPVLEGPPGIDCYYEIRHARTGVIAATFLLRNTLISEPSQLPVELPPPSLWRDSAWGIDVPAHGRPRSLALAEPARVDFATVASKVVDTPSLGMMSGRREGVVQPGDCDDSGKLKDDLDDMFLIAREAMAQEMQQQEIGSNGRAFGPPVQRDSQGRRYSWAMMETRSVQYRRPVLGDRVVSLGADVAWSEKWRHSRRWTYVLASGELLGIADSLGICIDLDARKTLAIPAELRSDIEKYALPQLL